jgi:hypothetical protein
VLFCKDIHYWCRDCCKRFSAIAGNGQENSVNTSDRPDDYFMSEQSARRQLLGTASDIIRVAYRMVDGGRTVSLLDLLTTAQGYVQLCEDYPLDKSYEIKLREVIEQLRIVVEQSSEELPS